MVTELKAKSEDPAWKYGSYAYPGKDKNAIKCDLCGKITRGGIYRHKQHLTRAEGNVKPCLKVKPEICKEIEEYMKSKKKRSDRAPSKGYRTSCEVSSRAFTFNDENMENDEEGSRKEHGEISMPIPTNVRKRPRVSCSADTYLTHNDEEKELFQISKDMERIIETTVKWFSLTGVPIEKVWQRLQEIGCCGVGPPPSGRELRESFLEKEVQDGLPCHRCGNNDHTAYVCRGSSSCEHCHEAGHRAIKCPTRRRSEESSPPLVIIPLSKEIYSAERQLGSCGVLSFESEIGSEKDVVDCLSWIWHGNKSWPICRLDENAFLVQFPSMKILQEATECFSIKYKNFSLLCRRWSKTDGEKRNPSDVWIKVGGFPLHCWDRASFQSLVASFGTLEELDRKTEERSELSEARMRISCLDPTKIPSSIAVMVDGSIYVVELQVEGCPDTRSSRGPDLYLNHEDVGISAEDATQQTDSCPVPLMNCPSPLARESEPFNTDWNNHRMSAKDATRQTDSCPVQLLGSPSRLSREIEPVNRDLNHEAIRISTEDATQQTDPCPVQLLEPLSQSPREGEPGKVSTLSLWCLFEVPRRLRRWARRRHPGLATAVPLMPLDAFQSPLRIVVYETYDHNSEPEDTEFGGNFYMDLWSADHCS